MKADEVKSLLDTLNERLNTTIKLLDELKAEHKKLQQEHNDYRREAEKECAVLKNEVSELKKSKDLWGNRGFTLVMCLVSALIGGIINSLVKKP